MDLGMVGLGRMGANMTERLIGGGHRVVAFDREKAVVERVAGKGALAADSIASVVRQLSPPRAVWLMVPAGDPVENTIAELSPLLAKGDTVIDGEQDACGHAQQIRRA
ncbi:MAG: hypothetical protein HY646_13035 [Acidobacteria bacterium]|nr:hypothetical protein [Acidobacteriota bacterium]